jgi:hypothetical protein
MHRYSPVCAALAATAILAMPAAALADGGTVIAGPIKAKGYSLSLTATDASDSVAVTAIRTAGGSQQMHSWSFKGAKVSIKGAKATIKGSLGRFGKLNAKVATTGKAKGRVPAGCTGTAGSARKGKLTGKSKLVLDSTFFKTVKLKSVKAQIVKSGKLDCSGNGGAGHAKGLMLMSSLDGPAGQLMVNVVKSAGAVTQTVMWTDAAAATAPATVFHLISARTGASGLTTAADLSSASAPAAGPFLSGTLAFTGQPMGTMATGTVTGGFTAKFDSIGAQSLPAGNDAMLMQQ